MFCIKCGNQVEDGSRFCIYCGNRFENPESVPVQQPAVPVYTQEDNNTFFVQTQPAPVFYPDQPAPQQKQKMKLPSLKIPKKYLLMGGAGAAVLVLVILLVSLLSGGSKPSYAMYLKDGQLYYHGISGKEGHQVTEDLTDGRKMENSQLRNLANNLEYSTQVTDDGKTLFYMEEIGSGKLFYRSLTDFDKEPVQIASGVDSYTVCKDGKEVIFKKNGSIYRYDMKEDERLAKNVDEYRVSEEGDVLYMTEDEVWYLIYKGEEEKLGSEITPCYTTEKGVVYYLDDDKLYRKPFGKDKEKLFSDVEDAFGFTEDGTFYFTRCEEMTLADFFKADAEYEYWMQALSESQITLYESIHYYNGKEAVELTATCGKNWVSYGQDSLAVAYKQYDPESMKELTYQQLEELCNTDEYYYSSIYDVAQMLVEETLNASAKYSVCIGGTVSVLDVKDLYRFVYSPDGKCLYILCEVDGETKEGTLMSAAVSGKSVAAAEQLDKKVSSRSGCRCVSEKDFIYYKNVEDSVGDLFVNGVLVAEDVAISYGVSARNDNGELIFLTDFDESVQEGTLQIFDGKETREISEEVYSYSVGPDGKVAFLYDYNSNKAEGNLGLYEGKVTEVADDVHDYTFSPAGELLILYDYNISKYRGTLAVFDGKKVKDLDDDVVALLTLTESNSHLGI